MIAIIDYGLGNIQAFANVYKKLNVPVTIAKSFKDLQNVTKIILPGVGDFDHAINKLENSGMREPLEEMVIHKKIPLLGVCVGMQILANSSEEGVLSGLGWIEGEVKRFDHSHVCHDRIIPIPHMGWNNIKPVLQNVLLQGIDPNAYFYFLHSYYFYCHKDEDILAISNYGFNFTCIANHENIFGVQFHPEKSHSSGIKILKNFSNL